MHFDGLLRRGQKEPVLCASIFVWMQSKEETLVAETLRRAWGPPYKIKAWRLRTIMSNESLLERQTTVTVWLNRFLLTQSLLVRSDRSWILFLSVWLRLVTLSMDRTQSPKCKTHSLVRNEDRVSWMSPQMTCAGGVGSRHSGFSCCFSLHYLKISVRKGELSEGKDSFEFWNPYKSHGTQQIFCYNNCTPGFSEIVPISSLCSAVYWISDAPEMTSCGGWSWNK